MAILDDRLTFKDYELICTGLPVSVLINSGPYTQKNKKIIDRKFPIIPSTNENLVLRLIKFSKPMTSSRVLMQFKLLGLREPTYEEAFNFGNQYLDSMDNCSIIFLHEPVRVRGFRRVTLIEKNPYEAAVYLFWKRFLWSEDDLFAAIVPK